jgi:hypothetical protein
MEFDNNAPVSDDQRRLAESKKITLQPVHTDVQPDDLADTEIAARHLNEPAIANVETDTEQNSAPMQPSAELLARPDGEKRSSGSIVAVMAIAAFSALALGLFFFLG